MKLKRLFAALALATVGALASAIGIEKSANKQAEPAEAATTDSSIAIYFTRPSNWGDNGIRIHTWDENGETEWASAYLMTFAWNNDFGQSVFVWHPSSTEILRTNFKFHNDNHGMESSNLTAPSQSTHYYYDNGWQTMAPETKRVYLYDYDNRFGGSVNIHAWKDSDNAYTTQWPGTQMTATPLSSNGLVYYADIYKIFDTVKFNWGDDQTTNIGGGAPANYCYVLASSDLSGKNTWWDNINYVYAHNWSQNLMMMRSIATSDRTETTRCLSTYGPAKSAYQAFVNDTSGVGTEVLKEINNNFATSKERLSAWAAANGEVFSNNTFSTKQNAALISSETANNAAIPIVIVMTLTLGAASGIFFLRKKRKI